MSLFEFSDLTVQVCRGIHATRMVYIVMNGLMYYEWHTVS